MPPLIRVVVCGNSLCMAGLAASLQAKPHVEVARISANPAFLLKSLDELAPAAVAFDLGEMPGDLAISLLRDRPKLILIGVDPSSDRMLLLSGREEQPVSAAELLQVITGNSVSGPLPNVRSPQEHPQERHESQHNSH